MTHTDSTCDVCRGESEGRFVGVAAVPAAPVSVAWCDNCLNNNAVPRFVAESWLFSGDEDWPDGMTEAPPEQYPLAGWTRDMTIWLGKERGYVKLPEALKLLWADEYKRVTA